MANPKLEYDVLPSSGYGVLDLVSVVVFSECMHKYAVSSLMDTAYLLSEQRESRLQHHTGGSSEGTGSKLRGISCCSLNENPKSSPSDLSDNEDLNESEDDDDERVETDDDRDDDEEEDDRSTDIEETDAKSTESDDEHQGKGDADMNIKHEVEKERSDEKPKSDEQATEAQPNDENKDNTEPIESDITSILDVPIQQDVPIVVPEPLHAVTVTVIPKATQAPPPPPPPPATIANNTKLKKELSELNYKEVIKESVKAYVVKEFKNFMPQFLPKTVSDFAIPIIKESVKAHAVNEDIIKESVKAHVGKETKKRRTGKETESLKKSSTPKESTKVFEMGSDDVDQTFEKKADDSEQLSPDANTKKPSLNVATNPKRKKNDWYKKSPSPEPQDPDWNFDTPRSFRLIN
nr:hypothetical protein [Tanacetum cinerariifolium]